MTLPTDLVLPSLRYWRRRRTMFSMSMMASSTTTPTAITNPARTMVLMVVPRTYRTRAPAISDRGMATTLMSAARHSYRKAPSTTITSTQPMSSAAVRLWSAISMKVAGRKIWASIWTPCRPGFNAASASSTPRVTSSVLAQGSFSTIIIRPGPPLMTASPIIGHVSHFTSATSRRSTVLPS